MLLWGERRDQGGDSRTAEMQRSPCHPRNDPPATGVSEPVLASSFPRKAAADPARCPSRGKVRVWVHGLSLLSSARALQRSQRCPGACTVVAFKTLDFGGRSPWETWEQPLPSPGLSRLQQTPPLLAHTSCPTTWDPQPCPSRCSSIA